MLCPFFFFFFFFKAVWIGIITAKYDTDLSTVRKIITQLNKDNAQENLYNENSESMETNLRIRVHLSDSWVFIDSTTAASRFFRIDIEQENVHFLTDVCNMEDLFLIDSILESSLTYNNNNNNNDNPIANSLIDNHLLLPLPSNSSLLQDDNDNHDNQLNRSGVKECLTYETNSEIKVVESEDKDQLHNRLHPIDASNLIESDNQNVNDDHNDDNSIDDDDNAAADDDARADNDEFLDEPQSQNNFISTNNTSFEGEIFIPSISD
ncbi:unnamed protein product [Schistosoma margrebowiei]|uniref:Diacylglycerol kinase iota-like domain-containing protein n=1 Tax=Schistosoma margrebowiei TaxID=48269 RepID=A0A3P8D9K0_9TREM|nr:unnamed protein product [Schistosoma margrebowiei]